MKAAYTFRRMRVAIVVCLLACSEFSPQAVQTAQDPQRPWSPLPPLANAGADREVPRGLPTSLNGGGTYDPDNGTLEYAWQQLGGEAVHLSSHTGVYPRWVAPLTAQNLVFRLTVSDGTWSTFDEVVLAVRDPPSGAVAPIASCGADRVAPGDPSPVAADGKLSSGAAKGEWALVTPDLVAGTGPPGVAAYRFTAEADGLAAAPDYLLFFAAGGDAPAAPAVSAQTVTPGAGFTLAADASMRWEQVAGEPVLETQFGEQQLEAPRVPQTLAFRLRASSAGLESAPALVTVEVATDRPISIVAPAAAQTHPGNAVTLALAAQDGVTYEWEQTHGPAVTLTPSAEGAELHFEAPLEIATLALGVRGMRAGVSSDPALAIVDVVTLDNNAPPELYVCASTGAARFLTARVRDRDWDDLADVTWTFNAEGWQAVVAAAAADTPTCAGEVALAAQPFAEVWEVVGAVGPVSVTAKLCDPTDCVEVHLIDLF